MDSISSMEIPWFVRVKKPTFSEAEISCVVISEIRVSKEWREICGIGRVVYRVRAILLLLCGFFPLGFSFEAGAMDGIYLKRELSAVWFIRSPLHPLLLIRPTPLGRRR
jgi:hypothetical protein